MPRRQCREKRLLTLEISDWLHVIVYSIGAQQMSHSSCHCCMALPCGCKDQFKLCRHKTRNWDLCESNVSVHLSVWIQPKAPAEGRNELSCPIPFIVLFSASGSLIFCRGKPISRFFHSANEKKQTLEEIGSKRQGLFLLLPLEI